MHTSPHAIGKNISTVNAYTNMTKKHKCCKCIHQHSSILHPNTYITMTHRHLHTHPPNTHTHTHTHTHTEHTTTPRTNTAAEDAAAGAAAGPQVSHMSYALQLPPCTPPPHTHKLCETLCLQHQQANDLFSHCQGMLAEGELLFVGD